MHTEGSYHVALVISARTSVRPNIKKKLPILSPESFQLKTVCFPDIPSFQFPNAGTCSQ